MTLLYENKLSLPLTVIAFTFRSETPRAVFEREKECQQTKLSPPLTVVASLSVVKRRRLFSTEKRNVNKQNKVIQQKQWPRHLGVILDSAIVILFLKK